MIRPLVCGLLLALAVPAQAATVAFQPQRVDLRTPPPPPGLHTGFSPIVITPEYVRRWHVQATTCAGCHITLTKNGRGERPAGGGLYGRPAEIPLPATALLFGTALAGVAAIARKRTR